VSIAPLVHDDDPVRSGGLRVVRERFVARTRAVMTIGAATARVPLDRERLAEVDTFCMFIGDPRSGHSLVGALLDAHPEIVLAHELDALKYLQSGLVGRAQLFSLIVREARQFHDSGREWTGYSYVVPGQWQGRSERPRVIGDKKGGASTARLSRRPELLARLHETVRVPLKLIHVVRNPFDNIATMHVRGHGSLRDCVDAYFALCRTNAGLRLRGEAPVLDLRHEDLVLAPRSELERLCDFLGLGATAAYLDGCSAVVHAAPHRSRHDVAWTSELIEQASERSLGFDFLNGYGFTD
jgi:hypothetical protein